MSRCNSGFFAVAMLFVGSAHISRCGFDTKKHFVSGLVFCNSRPMLVSAAAIYAAKGLQKDTAALAILKTAAYISFNTYSRNKKATFINHGMKMATFVGCDAAVRCGLEKIGRTETAQFILKKCEEVVGEKPVAIGCFVAKESLAAYSSKMITNYVDQKRIEFIQKAIMKFMSSGFGKKLMNSDSGQELFMMMPADLNNLLGKFPKVPSGTPPSQNNVSTGESKVTEVDEVD